jgi:hypothetical protein
MVELLGIVGSEETSNSLEQVYCVRQYSLVISHSPLGATQALDDAGLIRESKCYDQPISCRRSGERLSSHSPKSCAEHTRSESEIRQKAVRAIVVTQRRLNQLERNT